MLQNHAVAQAISRCSPIMDAWAPWSLSPRELCDKQNGPGTGFSPVSNTPQTHKTLLLSEAQLRQAWKPSENSRLFRISDITGKKVLSARIKKLSQNLKQVPHWNTPKYFAPPHKI
jgi:hypothetical protein